MAHAGMRVRARMTEPVVTRGDGLFLDGILAFAAFHDLPPEQREQVPPIAAEWAVDFDLPLARWARPCASSVHDGLRDQDGHVWGWCATQQLAPWQLQRSFEVRKRPAVAQMTRYSDAGTYHSSLGPLKAYDLSFPTAWAPVLEWLAVGDVDEVRRLLMRHVTHVGKFGVKGCGAVGTWEVEPAADVTPDAVCALRVMPAESEDVAEAVLGIRPPYHHVSRRCPVVGAPAC